MAEDAEVQGTSGGDWSGAFVSGLFNLGGGLLNYSFGKKSAKKAFKREVALWNMQNEYNKPINQMARLKEAGLNPNLVYGNGATSLAGSFSSAPKNNENPYQMSAIDVVRAYQDLRQTDAMTQQINAQTNLINAQAQALGLENKENGENGTSRATPYPVKVVKHVFGAGKKVSDTVARKGQDLPIWDVFDYLDGKFINMTR